MSGSCSIFASSSCAAPATCGSSATRIYCGVETRLLDESVDARQLFVGRIIGYELERVVSCHQGGHSWDDFEKFLENIWKKYEDYEIMTDNNEASTTQDAWNDPDLN